MDDDPGARPTDELCARLAVDLAGSFEDLVRAHQDRLFTIALRMTGDRRDAEEVAQDAFVRAYRALAEYDAERVRLLNLRPWLATIAVNLCRNRARVRRAVTVPIDGDDGPVLTAEPSDGPAARYEQTESRDHWAGLVAGLPERYRAPVVLRHVVGLDYDEMTQALGRPEGTLKAQVHRGLALLRAAHDTAERADRSMEYVTQEVIR